MNDYKLFLNEYITEAEEANITDEDDENIGKKKLVVKETFHLRDNFQIPILRPLLAKTDVKNKLITFTGQFLDAHSSQLMTPGPMYTFSFLGKDIDFLYNLFNTSKDQLLKYFDKVIEDTYSGEREFAMIKEAPHKILLIAILIESIQKNYPDMIECVNLLFGFTEYPILYRKFWPLGVQPDIMAYTVEHLPSKKFILTRFENILKLLKYDVNVSFEAWMRELKVGADKVYADLIQRIRNQIKNKFKILCREYQINVQNKHTQYGKSSAKQGEDDNLPEREGQHTNISNNIDRAYNYILTTNIDPRYIKMHAQASDVDPNILTSYVNQIISNKENKLYRFIENIVVLFMDKFPTAITIKSGEFFNFGIGLYKSLGSSKNETFVEIKGILDYWMNDIIHITNNYKSNSTINNYTRAVYYYFVTIMHQA